MRGPGKNPTDERGAYFFAERALLTSPWQREEAETIGL
jgi:hypothetical protein